MQPTRAMDDILRGLAEQDDELDQLLAGLDEAAWAGPSRCPGWSISDVLLHLAQTDEMALASAERRFTAAARRLRSADAFYFAVPRCGRIGEAASGAR